MDFPIATGDLLGYITDRVTDERLDEAPSAYCDDSRPLAGPVPMFRLDCSTDDDEHGIRQPEPTMSDVPFYLALFRGPRESVDPANTAGARSYLAHLANEAATALAAETGGLTSTDPTHGVEGPDDRRGPARFLVNTPHGPVAVVLGYVDPPR